MKKIFAFGAAALLTFGVSSCTKSGTCTCEIFGISESVDYTDLDSDEYDAVKTACTTTGICTWADS